MIETGCGPYRAGTPQGLCCKINARSVDCRWSHRHRWSVRRRLRLTTSTVSRMCGRREWIASRRLPAVHAASVSHSASIRRREAESGFIVT